MLVKILLLIFSLMVIAQASSIPHELRPKVKKLTAATINSKISALVGEKGYRLPTTSYPISYEINLVTHLNDENEEERFKFNGNVSIHIRMNENSANIFLHQKNLEIERVEAFDMDDDDRFVFTQYDDTKNEFDFMNITSQLSEFVGNKNYRISIQFSGELRDDNLGFYRSSYVNQDGELIWLATTQFQNVEARSAFPCYDEPGIRASFKISIVHGNKYSAISNMNGISSEYDDNNTITQFEQTPPVQTYLIAFIISDFKSVSSNSFANIPQRVFAKPQSIERGEADLALRYGEAILNKYEENFKLKYHLTKMDQVALPDFDAGAMENWGLVTYREEYLLFNKLTSRTIQKDNVMTVISHEFAHQYFGDFVSPVWWNFLWLNEGFATLYEWYLVSLIYTEDRLMDSFILNVVQLALAYDGNDVRAMTTDVETPSEIDDLFDDIAYEKSGSVLRMMQNVVGEGVWARGINYYLTEMGLKSATSADLYKGLQKAVDEEGTGSIDVSEVMGSWENQGGFPIVTVNWDKEKLTLTQERFLYKESSTAGNSSLWHIPINYVLGTNPNFDSTKPDLWMKKEKTLVISKENAPKVWRNVDWIILNAQQGYYYRVNYDENLWSLLTTQLYQDHLKIHLLNRAQLIDDSFQLARAKKVEYGVALGIMKYLKSEVDYVPWESAYNGIIQFKFWLEGTSASEKYEKFIQNLVVPIFTKYGMEVIEYEHKFNRYIRSLAIQLACQFNIEACLNAVNEKLENVLRDEEISPDLQSAIYQNSLRNADETNYRKMIQKMSKTEDQGQRTVMIAALGCTSNKILQKELLTLAIDSESGLRRQERLRVFNAWINGGVAGMQGAIEFILENYENITAIQEGRVESMLRGIASRISNQQLLTQFTQALGELKTKAVIDSDDESAYLKSASEIINWQNENAKNIEEWLDRNGATSKSLLSVTFIMLFSIFAKYML